MSLEITCNINWEKDGAGLRSDLSPYDGEAFVRYCDEYEGFDYCINMYNQYFRTFGGGFETPEAARKQAETTLSDSISKGLTINHNDNSIRFHSEEDRAKDGSVQFFDEVTYTTTGASGSEKTPPLPRGYIDQ